MKGEEERRMRKEEERRAVVRDLEKAGMGEEDEGR